METFESGVCENCQTIVPKSEVFTEDHFELDTSVHPPVVVSKKLRKVCAQCAFPNFYRCKTTLQGERCRLSDDHEYHDVSHRFTGSVDPFRY